MIDKIADSVVRHPWLYIVLFLGITVFFAFQLPKAEVDPDVKNQLPHDMQSRINLDKIEELFGGNEIVMIVFSADDVLNPQTLKRVKKISDQMERMKEFDRILSLFALKEIRGEDGAMIVDPAVKKIPKTDKAREDLRQRIKDNDMVYEIAVSKDFKYAAIVGIMSMNVPDHVAIDEISALLEKYPGPEPVAIAGMPWIRTHLSKDIPTDMRRFLPFGLLAMLIFLLVAFRQIRGVVLPFLMTIMAIIVAMGLIPMIGWKIQMVTVILPVLLIAVANDYGIHIFARYQEDNRPDSGRDNKTLAKMGIVGLGKPVIATGLTTIAGLLSLLTHIIIPTEQMGVLASAGVLFALVGSLLFIPAILVVLPKAKPIKGLGHDGVEKAGMLDRGLHWVAIRVGNHPGWIAIGIVVIVLVTATGISRLIVDTNPVNYYPPEAEVAKNTTLVNDNFGGASTISVISEGDIKDPKVLKEIDDFQTYLESQPEIDITSSIANAVRKMNEAMNDGNKEFDKIPDTRDAIAQYFLLYSMSGEPDDFDRLVDFPYKHAQLVTRINESSSVTMKRVAKKIRSYIADRPNSHFMLVGGFGDLFAELVDKVVSGQVYSLLLSLVLVAILVAILFKSVLAGLWATIPLSLAMLLLFGIMGYFRIELNIATAMLSSIMIGVGVDYTIHFLWRYRDERRNGLEPVEAIIHTLTTSGRGIIFNALSVIIGFSVLTLSTFLPVRFFGILVVVSIGSCLVGALVLLPALSLIFRPKFLEPKTQTNDVVNS